MVVIRRPCNSQSSRFILLSCSRFGRFLYFWYSYRISDTRWIFSGNECLNMFVLTKTGCVHSNGRSCCCKLTTPSPSHIGELLGHDVYFCIPGCHQCSTNECIWGEKFRNIRCWWGGYSFFCGYLLLGNTKMCSNGPATHIRKQLGFDLWYIFLGLFIICIIESAQIEDINNYVCSTFRPWSEINCLSGLIYSIYFLKWSVGMDVLDYLLYFLLQLWDFWWQGYPTVNTSFCSQFRTLSKVVMVALMVYFLLFCRLTHDRYVDGIVVCRMRLTKP